MNTLNVIFDLWNNNGCPTTDPKDTIRAQNLIQDSAIVGLTRQQLQILAATTDQIIALPSVTTTYLALLSDQDISIKINGGGTAIVCKAKIAGRKTLVFFNSGILSALTISNSGTVTANIDVIAAAH